MHNSDAATIEEYRRAPAWICGRGPARLDFEAPIEPAPTIELAPECGDTALNFVLDGATCTPDERAVEPLFRRIQDAGAPGEWSGWTLVNPGGCLAAVDIRAAVAEEFQRLPLAPSELSVEPPSGWTLVNADTVVFTDGAPQVLDTTVLGIGVRIRATPESFLWDFGDGSAPLRTSDPGRPWPEHTVAHRYTGEGTHQISLTTTWSAEYQIAGTSEWEPVTGTATTTSTSSPLTVHEARSHLVAGPTG